jgi:hypothetical protein
VPTPQNVLLTDGIVVASGGVGVLAAADPLGRLLGVDRRVAWPAGIAFVLYGAGLSYRILRYGPSRPLLAGIATLNTTWVVASLALLAGAHERFNSPARAVISIVAAIVAAFAVMQWYLWARTDR